jgi:hypothetical protein
MKKSVILIAIGNNQGSSSGEKGDWETRWRGDETNEKGFRSVPKV